LPPTHVVLATGDGLLPHVADDVRALPVVRGAAAILTTSVVVRGATNPMIVPTQALDGPALEGVLDPGVTAGALGDLRGKSITVDERLAGDLGWRVGDRVSLRFGDGEPARLRVVALFRRPLGFGQVVILRQLVTAHVSEPLDDAVLVATEAGASGATGVAGLRALVDDDPGTELLTRAQYLRRLLGGAREESLAVYALLGIVVAFSAIAAINALAVAVSERARDLELLRLIDATRRQLSATIPTGRRAAPCPRSRPGCGSGFRW
jgi:putative ABC transport system permease protein